MTIIAQSSKGEFRQVAIEPFVVQAGDSVQQIGNQLIVTRDGNVVATRSLSGESVSVPSVINDGQLIDKAIFFRSYPVSGVVATLTQVLKNTGTGVIRFKFSNGSEREFQSGAEALQQTDYIDTSPTVAEDVLIRKTMVNSPDEVNLETCLGAKCSIDMNANNPVTVTID